MEPARRNVWIAAALLAVYTGVGMTGLIATELWQIGAAALIAVGIVLILAMRRSKQPDIADHSRRRFLGGVAAGSLIVAGGGVALGEIIRRTATPTADESIEQMASDLGAEYMELARRGYYEGRSGELQLLVYPFNSANYAPESRSLVPNDPRSSHAAPWLYLERIPLVVYQPGWNPATFDDRVTLADLAPTTAAMLGTKDFPAPDGNILPGVVSTAAGNTPRYKPPKVIVTFVIDGGGWNALAQWPDAWPNLRTLMGEGTNFTNAINGANPAVTACAHATIATGAFPQHHGISGHFLRFPDGHVAKAYGEDGQADTSPILVPTLAEWWGEQSHQQAWIGELGYQIWHLGMIGAPASYPGTKPVAVFYDEDTTRQWQAQNPDSYRLPNVVPPTGVLDTYTQSYTPPVLYNQFTPKNGASVCCSPPIIRYEGDLIEATLDSEPVGQSPATSLLYINFKAPDYAGHMYNMLAKQEEIALQAVDHELGRLKASLDRRFGDDYVLIVTADHGQCPLVNEAGGVRLDPTQLQADVDTAFGLPQGIKVVQDVRPAEIYLERSAMAKDPGLATRIASSLRNYTYGDNVMRYAGVSKAAIQWNDFNHPEFAAILPAEFIRRLGSAPLLRFGRTAYPNTDVQLPIATGISSSQG